MFRTDVILHFTIARGEQINIYNYNNKHNNNKNNSDNNNITQIELNSHLYWTKIGSK